jgi:aspartate-semialdehyde dehydrogenase
MDELFNQTRAVYVNDQSQPEQFTKTIAFNCIPHIDKFMDDGSTRKSGRWRWRPGRSWTPTSQVVATCVRVPVFIGHAEAVHVEFENPLDEEQARDLLREAPGVQLVDRREDGGYVTQTEAAGEDAVYVSRLRRDPTVPNGLAFWCVSDNLRKGAALNAVQIAEALVEQG